MKKVKYFIGLILILAALTGIFLCPLPVLFYPVLPFISFLKRALCVILLSAFFCLFRIMRGPTASDRIVAIDMLGILIIGICCLLTITTERSWYIDIGIAWALQSFISTLALAKFLEGKDFDE